MLQVKQTNFMRTNVYWREDFVLFRSFSQRCQTLKGCQVEIGMSSGVYEGEEKLQRCAVLSQSDRLPTSVDFSGWKACSMNFNVPAMEVEKGVVGIESDVGICGVN